METQGFDALIVAGDLTDEKDCHSSQLVNQVIQELTSIASAGKEVHVLMGNHDYTVPDSPFFAFLSSVRGCFYHGTPQIREVGNLRVAFFPHTDNPQREEYRKRMKAGEKAGVDLTICHQMFTGARAESGRILSGLNPRKLSGAGCILSGDIHKPQRVGEVTYIGAPYPVRFGDSYNPRVILVNGATRGLSSLYPDTIQRRVLQIRKPVDIEYTPGWNPGDQVKIVVNLNRNQFDEWAAMRRKIRTICTRNNLELCGLELREKTRKRLKKHQPKKTTTNFSDPLAIFEAYCQERGIGRRDQRIGHSLIQ